MGKGHGLTSPPETLRILFLNHAHAERAYGSDVVPLLLSVFSTLACARRTEGDP